MRETMKRCTVLCVFACLVVGVGVSCSRSSGQGPSGIGIGAIEANQGSKKKGKRTIREGFRNNRPFAVWVEKERGRFGDISSVRCLYREQGGSTYLWEASADPVGNGLRMKILPSNDVEVPLDPGLFAQLPEDVRNRVGPVPPLVTTGTILITIIEVDGTPTDVELPAEETDFDPCDP